jgi:hypothetical protein
MLHPELQIGEDAGRFIAVHLALLVCVCLLAWTLVLLVAGVEGIAAGAARALVVPFAVAYAVFTTFGGLAPGVFVREANDLPADDQLIAATLIGRSIDALERPVWLTAIAFWLAAVLAVVVALRRRAPLPALALVAAGAAAFAKSHVEPWGSVGMAAFLAGIVWLELASSNNTPIGYDRADEPERPS